MNIYLSDLGIGVDVLLGVPGSDLQDLVAGPHEGNGPLLLGHATAAAGLVADQLPY